MKSRTGASRTKLLADSQGPNSIRVAGLTSLTPAENVSAGVAVFRDLSLVRVIQGSCGPFFPFWWPGIFRCVR